MKRTRTALSRRAMLRGVGTAISLPFLDIMSTPFAGVVRTDPMERPVNRIAYLYFPNGVADGSWKPEAVASDGTLKKLNKWMSPLEPFKQHLLLPENVWTPKGNGHGAGTATWLTGGGYDDRRIDAGGMSVDQLIATAIGDQTLLGSLELSVKGEGYFSGNLPRNSVSWRDSRTPLSRETEPRAVFDMMFRTSQGGMDKSVVDLVLANAKQMMRAGSKEDRRKLEEYLQSIRGIERRLKFAESRTRDALRGGELTDTLNRPQKGIPLDHEEYVRLMMDMIVLAFWADATRVSTFMLDHGQSNRYFDFIPNCKGTWHALSHYRDISGRTEDDDGTTSWSSVKEKRDMYNRVTRWHHQQYAYLLRRLNEVNDVNGRSLLDNSMICYGSSISDGNEHGERNLPMVIAGGGAGAIRTGRQLKLKRRTSMSKLHLSMIRAMGVKQEAFGGAKSGLDLGGN